MTDSKHQQETAFHKERATVRTERFGSIFLATISRPEVMRHVAVLPLLHQARRKRERLVLRKDTDDTEMPVIFEDKESR